MTEPLPASTGPEPPLRRRAALGRGVAPDHLLARPWSSPYRGVYRRASVVPANLQRVYDAAALLPPGGAVSGWAALLLHGVAGIDGTDPVSGRPLPVLLCVPPEHRLRDRAGVLFFRGRLPYEDITERGRVPVTTPLRACFDEMRLSTDIADAVAVADAAAYAGVLAPDELALSVAGRAGWRGVPLVRRALPYVDGRAASVPESHARVLWMLRAGLPRPAVNVPVYDASGNLLGIPDLLDVECGLVGEYDGAHHRDLHRQTADNVREEGLERHGLIVVRLTSIDIYRERVRAAWRLQQARLAAQSRTASQRGWYLERRREA